MCFRLLVGSGGICGARLAGSATTGSVALSIAGAPSRSIGTGFVALSLAEASSGDSTGFRLLAGPEGICGAGLAGSAGTGSVALSVAGAARGASTPLRLPLRFGAICGTPLTIGAL